VYEPLDRVADHQDRAFERLSDSVAGLHISRHVLVLGFAAGERAIKSIDNDKDWSGAAELRRNFRDEDSNIGDEIQSRRQQEKGRIVFCIKLMATESFDARWKSRLALAGDLDHHPRLDAALAIHSPKRHMQRGIRYPERLAAFGWSPHDDYAVAREQIPDDIAALPVRPDIFKPNERETPLACAVAVAVRLRLPVTLAVVLDFRIATKPPHGAPPAAVASRRKRRFGFSGRFLPVAWAIAPRNRASHYLLAATRGVRYRPVLARRLLRCRY
jgi:hypothetical protein